MNKQKLGSIYKTNARQNTDFFFFKEQLLQIYGNGINSSV